MTPIPSSSRWNPEQQAAPEGLVEYDPRNVDEMGQLLDRYRQAVEDSLRRIVDDYQRDTGEELPFEMGGLVGVLKIWDWARPQLDWRAADEQTPPEDLPLWVSQYEYVLSDRSLWLVDGMAALAIMVLSSAAGEVKWSFGFTNEPHDDARPVIAGAGWSLNPLARVRDVVLDQLSLDDGQHVEEKSGNEAPALVSILVDPLNAAAARAADAQDPPLPDGKQSQLSPQLAQLLSFALTHALDTTYGEEPIIPFLMVETGDERRIENFVTGDMVDANTVAVARDAARRADGDRAVLAYSGYTRHEGERTDSVMLIAHERSNARAVLFALPYACDPEGGAPTPLSEPGLVSDDEEPLLAPRRGRGTSPPAGPRPGEPPAQAYEGGGLSIRDLQEQVRDEAGSDKGDTNGGAGLRGLLRRRKG